MYAARGVWPVILGIVLLSGMSADADPPTVTPTPISAPPVPISAPKINPAQEKWRRQAMQRAVLHHQAQMLEQEAARQARVHQFDKAQQLYSAAASCYHQQARQARFWAQSMTKSGQMNLAARAHTEALAADTRYLACLASEVSAIKHSSVAEKTPPASLPKPKTKKPANILSAVPHPFPFPKPAQAAPFSKRVSVLSVPLRRTSVPAPISKRRPQIAVSKPRTARKTPVIQAHRTLPITAKALRQATLSPLALSGSFIAAQQHGMRQEMLRLRQVQLQEMPSPPEPPTTHNVP